MSGDVRAGGPFDLDGLASVRADVVVVDLADVEIAERAAACGLGDAQRPRVPATPFGAVATMVVSPARERTSPRRLALTDAAAPLVTGPRERGADDRLVQASNADALSVRPAPTEVPTRMSARPRRWRRRAPAALRKAVVVAGAEGIFAGRSAPHAGGAARERIGRALGAGCRPHANVPTDVRPSRRHRAGQGDERALAESGILTTAPLVPADQRDAVRDRRSGCPFAG